MVFVCEEDLWEVPAAGGVARRLTASQGLVSHPAYSPDGTRLAFSCKDEGAFEVYVMDSGGGPSTRLTYLGVDAFVAGWSREGEILFCSAAQQPFRSLQHLYAISPKGGVPRLLPCGPAVAAAEGPSRGRVIQRGSAMDPAAWKRYRGGTAGDLWIDRQGGDRYARLIRVRAHLKKPVWVGDRIYFVSDHEGHGNLYSCLPSGQGLRQETKHADFYVRNPSTDGSRIAYAAGGDLWVYQLGERRSARVEVRHASPRAHARRKFVEPAEWLESFDPDPAGSKIAVVARGSLFTMGNWEGAARRHGPFVGGIGGDTAIRYRLGTWLADGKRFAATSDAGGEERLEIREDAPDSKPRALGDSRLGRLISLRAAPKGDWLAAVNHRNELLAIDAKSGKTRVLDRSRFAPVRGFSWSPDGRWIAYACHESRHVSTIRLARLADGKTFRANRPVLGDVAPVFDPGGKYLYFLSFREFDPVYDNLHFDLGFPRGVRPYLIVLSAEERSPFHKDPRPLAGEEPGKGSRKKAKDPGTRIDLEGIENRVLALPVPDDRYVDIAAIAGKVLLATEPIEGALKKDWLPAREPPAKLTLHSFDLETRKLETVLPAMSDFKISGDGKTLFYTVGNRIRAVKTGGKVEADSGKEPGRESGWIDLGRLRVEINPQAEWRQIFRDAWRLQRDHYWSERMGGVDWEAIYRRYLPLVEKVSTRSEFSDLLWEMQGELGTSHAYVMGGDLRQGPFYSMGFLGANLEAARGGWRIREVLRGDPWDERATSPLLSPGLDVRSGDLIESVAGVRAAGDRPVGELLVERAGAETEIALRRGSGKARVIRVTPLSNEVALRYREWVEANRARVHAASKGRIGYLHVPDMGPHGYSEFHRYFLAEIDREGLIVDVRFNGGGHVSQLLLEKLARRRIGYDQSRWFGLEPFPVDSVGGPIVALTNEWAGSDGDIFSHSFKLLKLGPLIGKRTWGGVVGISPRHGLVDGGYTTQPEFSFWFEDVGWGVENYGTEPDIEIDIAPQEYARGEDPQLARAIREALGRLAKHRVKKPDTR